MKRINVYALKKNRKNILEELQRRGVIQIEDVSLDDKIFKKEETAQKQSLFFKASSNAKQAYEILESYVKYDKVFLSSFAGRTPISKEDYYTFTAEKDVIMSVASDISNLQKEIVQINADIVKYSSQIESLKPWESFDAPMTLKGTGKTAALIGSFSDSKTYEEIMLSICESLETIDDIHLEIVSSSENLTCVFILCKKEKKDILFDSLRAIGFSAPPVISKVAPLERIKVLEKRIIEKEHLTEQKKAEIISFKGMRNAFKFMEDYYLMRADKYAKIELLANSKKTFILTGYIKADISENVSQSLEKNFEAYVEIEELKDDEQAPVALKNNALVAPVESVLETYSLPKKGEVDPTSVMAIFYYIFFGMMFSDAGYGILMSALCAFALKKFKNMEDGLKRSVKMFMYCGITTTIFGFLYGSFFGDAVTVIGKTFFDVDIAFPTLWINPVTEPMTLLMISLLLGIIHLFFGLGMKAYTHIVNKNYISIIYDVISWYLFVGGLILLLMTTTIMEGFAGFMLPSVFATIGGICAAVGALIILFFEGRGSKPIIRFLKGAYGLYGITSYLSDILSYSRLLALGLATGVIAQVFNQIAAMGGKSIVGVIVFILIFIIGHTLNIGINAMGAYVHTNRLQFVEFFGKFYEGGGKKFEPFKIKTKNYKIKEEIL